MTRQAVREYNTKGFYVEGNTIISSDDIESFISVKEIIETAFIAMCIWWNSCKSITAYRWEYSSLLTWDVFFWLDSFPVLRTRKYIVILSSKQTPWKDYKIGPKLSKMHSIYLISWSRYYYPYCWLVFFLLIGKCFCNKDIIIVLLLSHSLKWL